MLTLQRGPAFRFLGASAIDNTDFKFSSIIGGTTTALGTIDIGDIEGNRQNGTGALTFGTPSDVIRVGDSMFVELGGSGGVDSLQIAPVPVPAALPLLLAGPGGLGLMKRRTDKAAKARALCAWIGTRAARAVRFCSCRARASPIAPVRRSDMTPSP